MQEQNLQLIEVAEKEAEAAPDIEKLTKLHEALSFFELPDVKSEAAKAIIAEVEKDLEKLCFILGQRLREI